MNRQQRRKKVRELRKELEWIKKHTEFNKIMQDSDLAGISHEDSELLKAGTHPNQALQGRFKLAMSLLKEVLKRESEIIQLTSGESEQNLPTVQ
jgi:hypothetical protein